MTLQADIGHLSEFLGDLRHVLEPIPTNDHFRAADPDLSKDLETSWQAFDKATDDLINELLSIRNENDPRAIRLQEAGLRDAMLAMKTRAMNRARPARRPEKTTKPPWLLRKFLRWANVLLGSLASVLPGAELLKEYKEAVEIGIDEAEGR